MALKKERISIYLNFYELDALLEAKLVYSYIRQSLQEIPDTKAIVSGIIYSTMLDVLGNRNSLKGFVRSLLRARNILVMDAEEAVQEEDKGIRRKRTREYLESLDKAHTLVFSTDPRERETKSRNYIYVAETQDLENLNDIARVVVPLAKVRTPFRDAEIIRECIRHVLFNTGRKTSYFLESYYGGFYHLSPVTSVKLFHYFSPKFSQHKEIMTSEEIASIKKIIADKEIVESFIVKFRGSTPPVNFRSYIDLRESYWSKVGDFNYFDVTMAAYQIAVGVWFGSINIPFLIARLMFDRMGKGEWKIMQQDLIDTLEELFAFISYLSDEK